MNSTYLKKHRQNGSDNKTVDRVIHMPSRGSSIGEPIEETKLVGNLRKSLLNLMKQDILQRICAKTFTL